MCWSHLNPLCLKDGQKEFYEEFKFHSCSLRLYAKSSRQMSVLTLSLNKQIIESQFFWLLFSKRTIGCCYNVTMNADWNTHSQHRHAYSYTVPEPTDRSSFSQCMQEALTLYIIHFKLRVYRNIATAVGTTVLRGNVSLWPTVLSAVLILSCVFLSLRLPFNHSRMEI